MQHGSESFFVEGEGLLTSQLGGRSGSEVDPIDDESADSRQAVAKIDKTGEAPSFHFSRMGPKGQRVAEPLLRELAEAMTTGSRKAGDVPAGYTYLGQFVDHDLTMDATDVALGTDVSPGELLQARSPRLDLDSLYGAGPANPGSAKFYEDDGLHLRVGRSIAIGPDQAHAGHDLPRVGKGRSRADRRTALIADPRNDENLIVAQTHLAMIHFHNRVVDDLRRSLPVAQRFREARRRVTLHYQLMLRHDYLPRIVRPAVLDDVWTNGRKVFEPHAGRTSVPTMPLEFSVAAFRLGHSMVRTAYDWNRRFPDESGLLEYMFQFSALGGDLGGEERLLSNWIADWRRMYDFAAAGHPALAAPQGSVNRAMRIDTLIADPLKNLPPRVFGGRVTAPEGRPARNLAFRNLMRANMVKLATGQQMATFMRDRGVHVDELTREQILQGDGGATLDRLTAAQKDHLASRTPLWFYILREAETNDGQLRGVGARIVAETFHRAMAGSRFSIVRDPDFRPRLGPAAGRFDMPDLLFHAFAGKATGINPLGGR